MAYQPIPTPGTVTVTEASTALVGLGTRLTLLDEGDVVMLLPSQTLLMIADKPTDDAAAVLAFAARADETAVSYTIIKRAGGAVLSERVRLFIEMLGVSDVSGVAYGWKFDPSTDAGNPGDGYVRFDTADPADATEIYIANKDERGADLSGLLDELEGALIGFRATARTSETSIYLVSGVSGSTFRTLTVTYLAPATSAAFVSGEGMAATFSLAGPQGLGGATWTQGSVAPDNGDGVDGDFYFRTTTKQVYQKSGGTWGVIATIADGDDGIPVGYRLTFDASSTTKGNPGPGKARANSATFGSITKLWVNNADNDALDITGWLDAMDDVTNAYSRGSLTFQGEADPSVKMGFRVTGTVTDETGYREINVSPVSGANPADLVPLVANFVAAGADGAGTGDTVGAADAVDGEAVLFSGTSGKLLKRPGASAMIVPVGSTAQRPDPPAAGMFRQNSDTGQFEGHDGTDWGPVGGSGQAVELTGLGFALAEVSLAPVHVGSDADPDAGAVYDSYDDLDFTDVAGGSNVDTSEAGVLKPTISAASAISGATGTNFGDMTAQGGLAAGFDGVTSQASGATAQKPTAAFAYIGKTYSGAAKKIDHVLVYGSNNVGFYHSGTPTITIDLYGKVSGAPADSTDGILLGTISFTDLANEAASPRTITSTDKATTFESVWVRISSAVAADAGIYLSELIIYEAGDAQDMSVDAMGFVASAEPGQMHAYIEVEEIDAATPNTDFGVRFRRAASGSYADATLSLVSNLPNGHKLYVTDEVDVSALTSGTSPVIQRWTANAKQVAFHGHKHAWGP